MRLAIQTQEFIDFYESVSERVQEKIDYIVHMMQELPTVHSKFIKKLQNTMRKINEDKISQLKTFDQHLDEKYGPEGSAARNEFEAKAKAWYYAECLKDARRHAGMTQQQLADRIGKKRTYISLIERGQTDMQLSTFIQISEALGLRFSLDYA